MKYYELKMTEEELRSFSDYLEELRYFADDEDRPRKKKSHFLRNAAIGTGLAAGALYAGNKGWLGSGMQRFSGNTIASAGSMFGSKSMTAYGNRGVATANYGAMKDKIKSNISNWESQQKAGTISAADAKKLESSKSVLDRLNTDSYRDSYINRQTNALTDRRMQVGKWSPESVQAREQAAVARRQATQGQTSTPVADQ